MNESELEVIKNKLKLFFPKSADTLLSSLNFEKKENEKNKLLLNKKETEIVKKYIDSNIKILIFSFKSEKIKTIFTIPGLMDKDSLHGGFNLLDLVTCNGNLYKLKLNSELKNNKIILKSQLNNKILPIFIEHSLLGKFNERERIAIYLHEIGHWVNYKLYFPKNLLTNIFQIQSLFLNPYIFVGGIIATGTATSTDTMSLNTFGYYALLYIIVGVCLCSVISAINIKNEYDSDTFASSMGFKDELVNVLKNKAINGFPIDLENDNKLIPISKSLIIMLSIVTPILISFFWIFKKDPIHTHPESKSRIDVLISEYIENNIEIISEYFNIFDIKIVLENINNIDFKNLTNCFSDLYASIDNLIYYNKKIIFPFSTIF